MVAFNKFECFVGDVGDKVHDLDADTIMVYLTNNVPSASADSVKGDLLGITEENGYAAADILNAWAESGGIGTLTGTDKEWTATAGGFGPFQYAVLYNSSASDNLIGWYDYGSELTLVLDEKFKVDFGASVLTLE